MKNKIFKEKIKVTISIDRNIYESIDELTTNKSRLIEWLLLKHLDEMGIDISNIYL